MRLRDRKKMIDRQSLLNIHLAQLIADLNQALEEAYRSLDELESMEDEAGDDGRRNETGEPEKIADSPPGDS